eukprot:13030603-Alexandrium_andersonii.AAC.1
MQPESERADAETVDVVLPVALQTPERADAEAVDEVPPVVLPDSERTEAGAAVRYPSRFRSRARGRQRCDE